MGEPNVDFKGPDFTIGDWAVSPRTLELRRDGEDVRSIRNKEMAVLVVLAEADGGVVLKTDLLDRVWPEKFVQEQVLTNAIFELRKAMDDSAKEQRYIGTVVGRGYRLQEAIGRLPEEDLPAETAFPERPRTLLHQPMPAVPADGPLEIDPLRRAPVRRTIRLRDYVAALLIVALAVTFWALNQQKKEQHYRDIVQLARDRVDQRLYGAVPRLVDRAQTIRADDPELLDILAIYHLVLGHKEAAIRAANRAIFLEDDPDQRRKYERRLAQAQGDTDRELALLQEGLSVDGDDAYWPEKLAWFWFTHTKDCSKSSLLYERALAIERAPNTLSYYGDALTGCREFERAFEILSEYEKGATVAKPDAYDLLGVLHALTGEFELAEANLRRAAGSKSFFDGQLHLGLLLVELGRFDEAELWLELYKDETESSLHHNEAYAALARLELARWVASDDRDAARLDRAEYLAGLSRAARDEGRVGFWILGLIDVAQGDLGRAKHWAGKLTLRLDKRGEEARAWQSEYLHSLEAEIALAEGNEDRAEKAFAECRESLSPGLFTFCRPTGITGTPVAREH